MTCCPRPITPYIHRSPRGTLVAHAPRHPPRQRPPFTPMAPPQAQLFLGGSSIAPNHPHLPHTHTHTPSCLSLSLKTPNCFLTSTLASLSFFLTTLLPFLPLFFSFLSFFLSFFFLLSSLPPSKEVLSSYRAPASRGSFFLTFFFFLFFSLLFLFVSRYTVIFCVDG